MLLFAPRLPKQLWLPVFLFCSAAYADGASETAHKPFKDSCKGLPQTLVVSLKRDNEESLMVHAQQTQTVMNYVQVGIQNNAELAGALDKPIAHNWDGSVVYVVSGMEQAGEASASGMELDGLRDKILNVTAVQAAASDTGTPLLKQRLEVKQGECMQAQEFGITEFTDGAGILSSAPRYWSYGSPDIHNGAANILDAHSITKGNGVTVGIVDTGLLRHHQNLSRTEGGFDFISFPSISGDGDALDADYTDEGDLAFASRSSWHGSHVQGSVTSNSSTDAPDFFGVAPEADAVVARVLGQGGGVSTDIQNALMWLGGWPNFPAQSGIVPRQKVDVINLSLGSYHECSQGYNDIFAFLREQNVLVVAAAGNDTRPKASSPGSCDNVIAVAAVDDTGNLAHFSNHGIGVDIAAPGVGIYSADNSGLDGDPGANMIDSKNGTSMASPHVAGVAALLISYARSQGKELTVSDLNNYLTSQSTTRPPPVSCVIDTDCTAGLLDAKLALEALMADMDGQPVLAEQKCLTEWQIIRNVLGSADRANALIPGGEDATCMVTSSSAIAGVSVIDAVESVPRVAGTASFTSSASQ